MIGIDQIKKGGTDPRAPAKTLGDPKNYMDMDESPNGDLTVKLYLPPYELDKLKAGYKKMVTIRLDRATRDQLREIFDSHKDIVAYTDGASIGNPGESGAGVVFFAKQQDELNLSSFVDNDFEDLDFLDPESRRVTINNMIQQKKQAQTHNSMKLLFSARIYLGLATNNQAEYTGLLLA